MRQKSLLGRLEEGGIFAPGGGTFSQIFLPTNDNFCHLFTNFLNSALFFEKSQIYVYTAFKELSGRFLTILTSPSDYFLQIYGNMDEYLYLILPRGGGTAKSSKMWFEFQKNVGKNDKHFGPNLRHLSQNIKHFGRNLDNFSQNL